jgi:hypothetical protein
MPTPPELHFFIPPYSPESRAWRLPSVTLEEAERRAADAEPYIIARDASGRLVRRPFPSRRPVVVRRVTPEA